MILDTISDLLTRLRNANLVKHRIVYIPLTKVSKAIINILKEENYIEHFEIKKNTIIVYLMGIRLVVSFILLVLLTTQLIGQSIRTEYGKNRIQYHDDFSK